MLIVNVTSDLFTVSLDILLENAADIDFSITQSLLFYLSAFQTRICNTKCFTELK